MKFLDEFADKNLTQKLIKKIRTLVNKECTLMEVCGTHTMAMFRFGIRGMLPDEVRVIAGPGCPVCVTPQEMIDKTIAVAEGNIITTYGDMFRVPGSYSSLEKERAQGKDVRIVYSAQDALNIAVKNSKKQVIFLAIGFETTAPATAVTIRQAKEKRVKNFSILCAHKLIPPAMEALCQGELNIDGFICPGHVSTIIGEKPYQKIVDNYKVPCVITGFEPLDMLEGIYALLNQINKSEARVENAYKRAVRKEGNTTAQKIVNEIFRGADSGWRGLGVIPQSGLILRDEFTDFDAEKRFDIKIDPVVEHPGCRCGEILCGTINPPECTNFGTNCTPESPLGPCMVSSEGTCAAWFKYRSQTSETRSQK